MAQFKLWNLSLFVWAIKNLVDMVGVVLIVVSRVPSGTGLVDDASSSCRTSVPSSCKLMVLLAYLQVLSWGWFLHVGSWVFVICQNFENLFLWKNGIFLQWHNRMGLNTWKLLNFKLLLNWPLGFFLWHFKLCVARTDSPVCVDRLTTPDHYSSIWSEHWYGPLNGHG